ncbi:hypothetical protein R6Q59_006555 [Mikania micrantha]
MPSLTPDLNLLPPRRNTHQRRRRTGGLANHATAGASEASHICEGVFYFGNVPEPGCENRYNQVDNFNGDSHKVDEVDETLRVGQLVGIDVADFRAEIEELIGGEGGC